MINEHALPVDFKGSRNCSTSIYYLLEGENFSSFHRIHSDEIWHYYAGSSPVEIISIERGKLNRLHLGDDPDKNQHLQIVVPKNTWVAAQLLNKNGYALAGCTVAPGFHFDDFEMGNIKLLEEFPHLETQIRKLIRF